MKTIKDHYSQLLFDEKEINTHFDHDRILLGSSGRTQNLGKKDFSPPANHKIIYIAPMKVFFSFLFFIIVIITYNIFYFFLGTCRRNGCRVRSEAKDAEYDNS
jgi:hypothetical protein